MKRRVAALTLMLLAAAACAQIAGLGDPPVLAVGDDAGSIDGTAPASDTGASPDGTIEASTDGGTDAADATLDAPDAPDAASPDAGPTALCGRQCPLVSNRSSSCVVHDGGVVCWGGNEDIGRGGINGQLPGPVLTGPFPAPLEGATGLAAGGRTTCAFLVDGGVACWGASSGVGQDAGTFAYATSVPLFANAVEVTLAQTYGCWRTNATTRYCIGDDTFGQLANGVDDASFSTPVLSAFPGPYVQTSASPLFDCALQDGGAVYCVGSNDAFECDPSTSSGADRLDASSMPLPTISITQIALGYDYACGIGVDTHVYCWGSNWENVLGTATGNYGTVNTASGPLTDVVALSPSAAFCALTRDGHVYCWGQNQHGDLGRGFVSDASDGVGDPIAAPVLDSDGGLFSDVTRITGQYFHTCAMKTNGEVWCWGGNGAFDGQSADGGDMASPSKAF